MKIRKAKLEDLDFIMDCIYQIGVQEEAINNDFDAHGYITNKNKSEIVGNLISDDYLVLIGEDGDNTVGIIFGHIYKELNFWKYKKLTMIDYIFVWEKYRKKGFAQELYQEFISQMKKMGVDTIRLKVMDGNQAAISLYEKLGFKRVALVYDNKL